VSKKCDLLKRFKKLPSGVLDTIVSWTIDHILIPTGIAVSGAGNENANGAYAAIGICEKKLMFTKQGGDKKYEIKYDSCSYDFCVFAI
jgi:hypothetical protein